MRPLLLSHSAPCEACNRQTVQDAVRGDQVCPGCGLVCDRVYYYGESGTFQSGQRYGRCELGSFVGLRIPGTKADRTTRHMRFLAKLHVQTTRQLAGRRYGIVRLTKELVADFGLPIEMTARIAGEARRIVHLSIRAGLNLAGPTIVCTAVYMTARREGLPVSVQDITSASKGRGHRMKAKFILRAISMTPELCTEFGGHRKTARDYFVRIINSIVTHWPEKVELTGLTKDAYESRVLMEAVKIWRNTPRGAISSCKPTGIASAVVYGATVLLDAQLERGAKAYITQRDIMKCSDIANEGLKWHWQRLFAPIVRTMQHMQSSKV